MNFLRKYNTLLVTGTTAIRIPIIKRAVVDFALGADWTPAAGDVKVFVDGAAVANITNLPTAIASGNTAQWEFILTAAELSCKQLLVMVADSATKAIEDQAFIVETFGHASAMYAADLSLANLPANVTQLLGTAWLAPAVAGTPDVNAKQLGGQTVSAAGAVTMPGTVASSTNITAGTITTTTNLTNLPAITANWLTAAGIAAGALDGKGNWNIGKTGYALSAAGVQAMWDALTAALTTVGSIGKKLADWTIGTAQTGDAFARLGAPAGASVSADVAAIQADTDNLQTRVPAALTGGGNMKADALALNGDATAAATLAILNGANVVYRGTISGATTTTTLIDSGLTQASADWWKGRIIIFTSGLTLQATDITAFDPATDKLTFTAVTAAPTAGPGGDTYVII